MLDYNPAFENAEVRCDFDYCFARDTFYGTFEEIVDATKAAGWKAIKRSEVDWDHLCPMHAGWETNNSDNDDVWENE